MFMFNQLAIVLFKQSKVVSVDNTHRSLDLRNESKLKTNHQLNLLNQTNQTYGISASEPSKN